ncbi:FG-GAP-like repeat-containing protein [Flavobacterium sp.]
MIKNYFSILVLLFGIGTNAQIGFLNNRVIDGSYSVGSIIGATTFDADGDGDLDVISASATKIAWQENLDGQGNFGDIKTVVETPDILSFSLADIDGDSDLDVLFTSGLNIEGRTAWCRNLGNAVFAAEQLIALGDYSSKVAKAGDIDGDGDLDVVTVTTAGTLKWFKNSNGQGTFIAGGTITTNTAGTTSIDIKDADGDGDNDVVCNWQFYNQYIRIAMFRNLNGLGSFGAREQLNNQAPEMNYESTCKVFFKDLDNDNDNDIFFYSNSRLAVMTNTGGVFSTAVTINWGFTSYRYQDMDFTDMDADGDLDIVTVMNRYQDPQDVIWYENDSSHTYTTSHTIMSNNSDSMISFKIVDIDNDGIKDIMAANYNNNYVVWHKSYAERKAISKFTWPASNVKGMDVDNDGDLDLVSQVDLSKLVWYENLDGAGSMGTQKVIFFQDNAYSYDVGDIDGDGKTDIAIDGKWLRSHGDGTFTFNTVAETFTMTMSSVRLVDVDSDGKLDIIYLDNGGSGSSLGWHKNLDGLGSFGARQEIIPSTSFTINSISAGDVDGDNDIDLVFSSSTRLGLIKNNGGGVFGSFEIISIYSCSGAILTDMDGDGDKDVLVSDGYHAGQTGVGWFMNNDGTFSSSGNFITSGLSVDYAGCTPIDLDSDGDVDVLTSKGKWMENLNGLGFFGTAQPRVLIPYPAPNTSGALADLDNDGKKDILYSETSSLYTVSWYKNNGLSQNKIVGTVKLDLNQNGCDASDNGMQNVRIVTQGANENYATFTNNTGYYQFYIPGPGNYTTAVASTLPNYFSASPASHTNNFTGIGSIQTSNFCVAASQTINDLEVSIYPTSEARPGFPATYAICYKNRGTTVLSGNVKLQFDASKLTFTSAIPAVNSQITGELSFIFSSLAPSESRMIRVNFNVATIPTVNIGNVLNFTATVNPIIGDATPENNVASLGQTVIGSYDPNDIAVLEGERIFLSEIDEYLHYRIRFQNTGTASAVNVVVTNTLDNGLDWNSLEIDGVSHNHYVSIRNGNQVSFVFNGIYLPDSTSNEAGSQGFICYKIKPKSTSVVGNVFYNDAHIYFDFNPAIDTNVVSTEVTNSLAAPDHQSFAVSVYPNPTNGRVQVTSNLQIKAISLLNVYGQRITDSTNLEEIDLTNLSNGIYFIRLTEESGRSVTKKIIKR